MTQDSSNVTKSVRGAMLVAVAMAGLGSSPDARAARAGEGSLRSVPPTVKAAEVSPMLRTAADGFAHARTTEKLVFVYTAQQVWTYGRHPATGVLMWRDSELVFGSRIAPIKGLLGTIPEQCQVEVMRIVQQSLGNNHWGDPYLAELVRDDGTAWYAYKGLTCDALTTMTTALKADTSMPKVALVL